MNSGVYLIVSPSNGRYVGSSKYLNKRFSRYRNYSCSRQSAILASLKKYGFENHKITVLMYCDPTNLLFWERVFGDIYLASAEFKNGLNITLPGYGDVPQVRTSEFRERVSKIQKRRFEDPEERRKTSEATKSGFTDEVKARMSKIHKKRFEDSILRSERSRARQSYYYNNPEAKDAAARKTREGYIKNPELKEAAKATLVKFHLENPEARFKKGKKVINTETGQTYINAKFLAKEIGCTVKYIQNRLSGQTPNCTPYKYL